MLTRLHSSSYWGNEGKKWKEDQLLILNYDGLLILPVNISHERKRELAYFSLGCSISSILLCFKIKQLEPGIVYICKASEQTSRKIPPSFWFEFVEPQLPTLASMSLHLLCWQWHDFGHTVHPFDISCSVCLQLDAILHATQLSFNTNLIISTNIFYELCSEKLQVF